MNEIEQKQEQQFAPVHFCPCEFANRPVDTHAYALEANKPRVPA